MGPVWLQALKEARFITDEHVSECRIADDVGDRKPGHGRKLDIANGKIAPNADEIAKLKKFSEELIKTSSDIDAMVVRTYAQPDEDYFKLAS